MANFIIGLFAGAIIGILVMCFFKGASILDYLVQMSNPKHITKRVESK